MFTWTNGCSTREVCIICAYFFLSWLGQSHFLKFAFDLRGGITLCCDVDFQHAVDCSVQLNPVGRCWRQEPGQVDSLCAVWYCRIHWNYTQNCIFLVICKQSSGNFGWTTLWKGLPPCRTFQPPMLPEGPACYEILPLNRNWTGTLLMASLVVFVLWEPPVWVSMMLCLGKSSMTNCTAYRPSSLLLVGLNDRVQACKRRHKTWHQHSHNQGFLLSDDCRYKAVCV